MRTISFLSGIIFIFIGATASGSILKGPYLQNVKTDQITVMWETETTSDGRVDYGLTPAYGLDQEGTASFSSCGRYLHEITLFNLQTGTLYYYRVESGGESSDGSTFRAAPLPGASLNLVVYGDTRSDQHDGYVTHHQQVAQAILNSGSPDLIVQLGDVVEFGNRCQDVGSSYGWGPEYFNPAQLLFASVPQFAAIGNHEYYDYPDYHIVDPPVNYQDYFSFPDNGSSDPDHKDLWYSFDYGDVHFTVINSNYFRVSGNFAPGSEQYQWIVNDLRSTDRTWKFAAFHHPPYARAYYHSQDERYALRDYLVPLFERYGVQLVFGAHHHFYERSRKRGIYYVVSGGGGAPLYSVGDPSYNPYSIYAQSLYEFCRLNLAGSQLSFSAVNTSGGVVDSFQMDLNQDEDGDGYLTGDEFSSGWDPSDRYSPFPSSPFGSDYDGNGTAAPAIFRPGTGLWAVRGVSRSYFGADGDWPASGDYDGDGTTELAIFRADYGLWGIKDITRFYFGGSSDLPVPGDYNGDGTTQAAIFRPAYGLWAIRGESRFYLGKAGDRPLREDFNGDGTSRAAIFRAAGGLWSVRNLTRFYFGTGGDYALLMDSDGSGTAAASIFRAGTGLWAIRGISRFYFGAWGDHPLPADYSGDGITQTAIFRSNYGLWAVRGFSRFYFGGTDDLAVSH